MDATKNNKYQQKLLYYPLSTNLCVSSREEDAEDEDLNLEAAPLANFSLAEKSWDYA